MRSCIYIIVVNFHLYKCAILSAHSHSDHIKNLANYRRYTNTYP